jgi:hypothetical protein
VRCRASDQRAYARADTSETHGVFRDSCLQFFSFTKRLLWSTFSDYALFSFLFGFFSVHGEVSIKLPSKLHYLYFFSDILVVSYVLLPCPVQRAANAPQSPASNVDSACSSPRSCTSGGNAALSASSIATLRNFAQRSSTIVYRQGAVLSTLAHIRHE